MDADTDSDGDCIDSGGSTRYYYHQNSLFSVVALSDTSANYKEGYQYDPYGRHVRLTDGNDGDTYVNFNTNDARSAGATSNYGNPYLFTGQRLDSESGLYYYKNRYYSTSQGRFISRDPIKYLGGINLYAYVLGAPLYYVDPLGLWPEGTIDGGTGEGHSNLPGFGRVDNKGRQIGDSYYNFDYNWLDTNPGTSPWNSSWTWLHFQPLAVSEALMAKAVGACNHFQYKFFGHMMQDFFSHYGQGYRYVPRMPSLRGWGFWRAPYEYVVIGVTGHGLQTVGGVVVRLGGIGGARMDNAEDYRDAYNAALARAQLWLERWDACCCKRSKDDWIPKPGRSEEYCNAKPKPYMYHGDPDKAPPSTPTPGYWNTIGHWLGGGRYVN